MKLRTLILILFVLVPSWIVISTPAGLLLHYNSSHLTSAIIHSLTLSLQSSETPPDVLFKSKLKISVKD